MRLDRTLLFITDSRVTTPLVITRATLCERGSLREQRDRTSVCPCVRHEPVLCQNEESYSVMISSLSGSPTILVF